MKKLLSFVAVLAMALVVAAPAVAKADTYYLDASATDWTQVSVWSWSTEDELWQAMTCGMTAWPGIELQKDATTGYYSWETPATSPSDICVMFNNGGAAGDATEQTCDATAKAAAGNAGKVLVLATKNTADDEAADPDKKADQWYGEWAEVGAAAPAEETPAEETPAEETPADETPADETPAVVADGGKDDVAQTADVAPIAAVAVLAVASCAVVVATRKKMA